MDLQLASFGDLDKISKIEEEQMNIHGAQIISIFSKCRK